MCVLNPLLDSRFSWCFVFSYGHAPTVLFVSVGGRGAREEGGGATRTHEEGAQEKHRG